MYQLRVGLRDIEPPIWRRIQVWEDTKLPRLHRVLQLLFNWEDYHLLEFVLGRRVYAKPDPDDDLYGRKVIDERQVELNRLVDRVGDEFGYHDDFGDNWRRQVLLEGILLPESDAAYSRCIASARNGPPEDAGGTHGYADYLEALQDSEHEEHEQMLQWREPFDAEAFSLERVNAELNGTFQRRKRDWSPARVKAPEPASAPDNGPVVKELSKGFALEIPGGIWESEVRSQESEWPSRRPYASGHGSEMLEWFC